jgi:dolichyl-diphosphooligosaccharide--protein glycosyltransferase/undecaprenyl-diphosphooligosaccharide--protein glycosyltransferase
MLKIEQENMSFAKIVAFMAIAYIFSFAIRLIWIFQFSDVASFNYNGGLMINTNDGYLWASSALNELKGGFENNPRIMDMYSYGTVFFTYWAAKVLPFSFDTIILYMPIVISSLVVIPIILIARLYKLPSWGLFAALLGSIAWSYYNRTMAGYYDTDMFSAMAPMFILYFLIRTIEKEDLNSALLAALTILVYPFLYDAGLSIVYAMGIIYMVYMVVFHRYEIFTYQSIIMISIALMGISPIIKLAMIIIIYFLFRQKEFHLKYLAIVSALAVFLFMLSGNVFSLILAKITVYTVRGSESEGLKFFQVAQTVREAGKIPFEVMANRISGSTIGLIISLIGYILLVIKHRPFILALPLIGIGVFSLFGGLRFTVYAVPVAAMSAIFLFYVIASYVPNKIAKYSMIAILTAGMIFPNITHILGYKVPTVFMKDEVKILDKLNSISDEKDYTLTWWDYGYPIWYYSNTNTLIDGGKHNHDNFIISKILNTPSQTQAANLARLAVETYVDSNYSIVADRLFKDKDPNDFLEKMESEEFKLPDATRDVFIYLPNRLLNIFPTVGLFSNIDLKTGQKRRQPFFYKADRFKDDGKRLYLGNGIVLDKATSILHLGKQQTAIKQFVIVVYDKSGKLNKKIQTINPNANISIIYMQSYNSFLVLDESMYNSLFIQLFVLENYDKDLFELVISHPLAKVYKLKK